ncbi:MAG: exosortase A [Stellaceae bacterium]
MIPLSSRLTSAAAGPAAARRSWAAALAPLGIGSVMLAAIFWPEVVVAFRAWSETTAYNYCFLVLPVAAYLAWDRRNDLVPPQPLPVLVLLALPVAFCWFIAERVGIWEARQFLAMVLLQILFLSVLGPRCWRRLAVPLLYLFFMVPMGEFLIPILQNFTAHFMATGLDLLRIPNFSSGVTIEIPEGSFRVAEACAGLRFLLASAAFSVLYACVMYQSPMRRLLFVVLSLIVPVIANGFRALGLVVLAHLTDSAAAVEADHILYGYLFFSLVTFALILIGLPFRQPARHPVAPPRPGRGGPIAPAAGIAAAALVLITAVPLLAADRLDDLAAHEPIAAGIALSLPPDCAAAPLPAWSPAQAATASPGIAKARAYRCRDGVFVVTVHRYPARLSAHLLFAPVALAPAEADFAVRRSFETGSGAAAQRWWITEIDRQGRDLAIARAVWVDGRPVRNALAGRLRQALNTVSPAPVPSVAIIVAHAEAAQSPGRRQTLDRFLAEVSQVSARPPAQSAKSKHAAAPPHAHQ